ncbi:4-(cytidine 5'-diphospho)-2-C-methyl-D-erythritol kinase [Candidatus Puniceispirillum marinum]|nr:4-(cytidine 5'-diphospho)-2-C-methyl-D-erythritol kinase [Candidatus Puniceispirillum marinum]
MPKRAICGTLPSNKVTIRFYPILFAQNCLTGWIHKPAYAHNGLSFPSSIKSDPLPKPMIPQANNQSTTMTGTSITEMAPAKVNLYLRICGRRDDGYHLLDSAVIFTAFGDQISLTPAATDSLTITGSFATALTNIADNPIVTRPMANSPAAPNLCMQALTAFRDAGGVMPPVAITLDKRIPVGAGLGGGSADAAAMLRALNAHADKSVTPETLHALATRLGADVPACLRAHALRMTGIGDQISSLSASMSLSPAPDAHAFMVLANPLIPLATKDVFAHLHSDGQGSAGDIDTLDISGLVGLGNDLEATACTLVPEIASLLSLLRQQHGCQIAAMSGSGASCFALFDSQPASQQACVALRKSGIWAEATHSL